MPAAKFERFVLSIRHHDVDHSAGVLLKSQRLKPEEVLLLGQFDVNETIAISIGLENVRVGRLADLALKLLPHVAHLVWLLLDSHFLLQPEFEALVVNESDRAFAFAGVEQWISLRLLATPANFALHIVPFPRLDNPTVDLNSFFLVEIVVAIFVQGVASSA